MDWKRCAIADLRKYHQMQQGQRNLEKKISILEGDVCALRPTRTDRDAVSNSGISGFEDKLINNIAERERLRLNHQVVSGLVEMVDAALATLSERERLVLERFYINRCHGYIDRLCQELGYEKSHVYRLKDEALTAFTVAMYGIVDL